MNNEAAADDAKLKILFVDDEPQLVMLGERFLRSLGYEPVTATSPEVALARFREGGIDAVITDLTMPGMSGVDMGQRMLTSQPDLPIILTTGFTQLLEDKNPASLGFRSLVPKPYSIRELGDALRSALASCP
jgi:CheY-like chemotaxis protein